MKKACTFLIFASLGLTAAAQASRPFVEEGKTWKMEVRPSMSIIDPSLPSFFEYYVLEGDTVIAGRVWKKLYFVGLDGERALASALYEEDGRVFFLPCHGATEGKLLYDFNPAESDAVTIYNPGWCWSLAEAETGSGSTFSNLAYCGTITLPMPEGEIRKYMFMFSAGSVPEDRECDFSYLEGVGYTSGPLSYDCVPGHAAHVVECTVGGKRLYEASLWGWVETAVSAASLGKDSAAPVYDLSGRRLDGVPAKGLYIQCGRKYMAK